MGQWRRYNYTLETGGEDVHLLHSFRVCIFNVLLLRDKSHGFVEFAEEFSAVGCLQYYEATPLVVEGQRVEFNYSGRGSITTKKDPEANPPNRILLLTVTNLLYPVTVDVLVKVRNYTRNEWGRCNSTLGTSGEDITGVC